MSSLNIAARALTTNMSVLQTIGNNIANVNTEGFSRQTVSLSTVEGNFAGGSFFGNGVQISAVRRSYDAFLTKQANSTASVAADDAVRYQKLQQIEALFPMGTSGLGAALNSTLNAWVDVASSPTDSTARGVVLDRANDLASRFRGTSDRLDELGQTTSLQTTEVVKAVNSLAQQIAALNDKVSKLQTESSSPNELLDQRDQLIREMNKYVQTTSIPASDNTITVFAAGSMPLVLGASAATLEVTPSLVDGSHKLDLFYTLNRQRTPLDHSFLGGGELSGLMDFYNNDLAETQNQLGRLAISLATQVNQQQNSGLDLNGAVGTNFFRPISVNNVFPSSTPTPTATLNLAVDTAAGAATQFQASDYEVSVAALLPTPTVNVRRLSDGIEVLSGVALNTAPTFDGLKLTLAAGTLAAGNTYVLRPFADGARNLDMALTAPSQLAVASPATVAAASTNTGTTTIEGVSMTLLQGALPATVPSFALTFNAGTGQFAVPVPTLPATVTPANVGFSSGSPMVFTYNDGVGNQYQYKLTLRGEPKTGDVFTLNPTPPAAAKFNAGNAQAMLALRDVDSFQGVTLSDGYVSVFSDLATRLQGAKFSAQFSDSQAAAAETLRTNVSGVNLDEEAAKLIQYQQSYQASAKFMQTAQGLFDTLIASFR